MVIGYVKKEPTNPYDEPGEIAAVSYFPADKPISIIGKLYNRKDANGMAYPDLYLARKVIMYPYGEHGSDSWASIEYTAQELGSGRHVHSHYQSYDGHSLMYHAPNEKEYMWLQLTEIDVVMNQGTLAQEKLERWED